jgi:hypothetical protein
MKLGSAGDRKGHRYELITARTPTGVSVCVDGVWMKPKMTAVLKARP